MNQFRKDANSPYGNGAKPTSFSAQVCFQAVIFLFATLRLDRRGITQMRNRSDTLDCTICKISKISRRQEKSPPSTYQRNLVPMILKLKSQLAQIGTTLPSQSHLMPTMHRAQSDSKAPHQQTRSSIPIQRRNPSPQQNLP